MTAKEFLEKQSKLECSLEKAHEIITKYLESISNSFQQKHVYRIERGEKVDGLEIVEQLNNVSLHNIDTLIYETKMKGWRLHIDKEFIVIGLI